MIELLDWDSAQASWVPLAAAAEPDLAADGAPAAVEPGPTGDGAPVVGDGAPVVVADSWLVADGRVRRLDLHRDRFTQSALELGAEAAQLRQAWDQLPALLPADGRWFPRINMLGSGALTLTLRPAPAAQASVIAWLCPTPDRRRLPRRKGPELQMLGELRDEAATHGAGEALLADADGLLLEGAYSSLLWWEGERLCAVPDEAPVLPGITRRLLLDLAQQNAISIDYRRPSLDQLAGKETWLVSALHGIRAVSAWADGGPTAGAPSRAPDWQQRLTQLQG